MNHEKYLSQDERSCLLSVLGGDRDSLMLSLLLFTGCRSGELLNLRKRDLNASECSVLIKGTKGSTNREIPLPRAFYARLEGYSEGRDRLFPISYNRLRDIWMFYRPVKKKLHSLRHTFAIELYRKTLDIRLVQRALGHRNIETTMIYQDYQYGIDELRKALVD